MNSIVFTSPPDGFQAQAQAAGCYLECQKKILFLKRHPAKPQGDTWGVPGGKLELNETPTQAVIREIHEEIGIDISDNLQELGKLYIQLPHIGYIFYLFCKKYEHFPPLALAMDEHTEARWTTIEEAHSLPLIVGGKEALEYYQQCRSN